jgi:hypothetical protein
MFSGRCAPHYTTSPLERQGLAPHEGDPVGNREGVRLHSEISVTTHVNVTTAG